VDSTINTLFLSCSARLLMFGRSMILERHRKGIAIVKAAGKYRGRKASLTPTHAAELRQRLADGESVTALSVEYGASRRPVQNYKAA